MAEIPGLPGIPTSLKVCPWGQITVVGAAMYKGGMPPAPPRPIVGARFILAKWPIPEEVFATDVTGVAQTCSPFGMGFALWVQKDGIDFGSGVGVRYRVGSYAAPLGTIVAKAEALTEGPWIPPPPPPPPIPCVGTLSAYVPGRPDLSVADAIASILSGVAALPSSISVFISSKVGDATTGGAQVTRNIPIKVYVDGREVPGITMSGVSFDVIRVVQNLGLDIGVGHTVRIVSQLPDCNIPETSFSIPRLVPGLPPPVVPCPAWATEAVPSIPSILQAPFTIGISGANWVCTPTGERTPIDAVAEVIVVGSRFSLPIRSGVGSLTLDQSQIAAILAGVPVPPVLPPVPPPVPLCEKTGRIGEPGRYLVPLSEVQAFLNQCFPGGVAAYAPPGDPWTGAFKITRGPGGRYPAGSYFWANTWEGIRGTY